MSALDRLSATEAYQRLHITPFKPDLLKVYLGPSLALLAKNISYHSVQNNPEVGFGYLDLPMAEAAKIKKKLNGSILKGHKIRIEDAQPEKRKRSLEQGDEEGGEGESAKKKTRRGKKSKENDRAIVMEGVELEEGRKVKRGWTETPAEKISEKRKKSKDSKAIKELTGKGEVAERALQKDKQKKKDKAKREVSKYTNEPECLFRTKLPNVSASAAAAVVEEDGVKEKKPKKEKNKKKAEVVVHEFAKTRKQPSFLKGAEPVSAEHATREYVDGKGWIDAQGNVLEAETVAQKEKRARKERRRAEKAAKAEFEAQQMAQAELAAQLEKKQKKKLKVESTKEPTPSASEVSSPEPSSSEPSDDESSASEVEERSEAEECASKPEAETVEVLKSVHPLEALYKRPLLSPLDTTPKTTKRGSFSFFAADNDSDIEQDEPKQSQTEPQTPFNEADLRWRGSRSAAPTPDTAAIGKRFTFSVMDEISEDDDTEVVNATENGLGVTGDDAYEARGKPQVEEGDKEESEFAKWFYDNRGANNKKWKERRREAMKMKRKRENRRLTRRIV